MVFSHSGILLIDKQEWTSDICNKIDESQKHYFTSNKLDTEENLLYDSIYMKSKNR